MATGERHEPCGLSHLAVSGYRSLQDLTLPLAGLTLVCGANGSGKSNLTRSLALIAAAARGDLVAALAVESGRLPDPAPRARTGRHDPPGQTVLERAAWRWP